MLFFMFTNHTIFRYSHKRVLSRRRNIKLCTLNKPWGSIHGGEAMHAIGTPFINGPSLKVVREFHSFVLFVLSIIERIEYEKLLLGAKWSAYLTYTLSSSFGHHTVTQQQQTFKCIRKLSSSSAFLHILLLLCFLQSLRFLVCMCDDRHLTVYFSTQGTEVRATVVVTNDSKTFSNALDFTFVAGMLDGGFQDSNSFSSKQ